MSTLETGSVGALWWQWGDGSLHRLLKVPRTANIHMCARAPSMYERWVVRMRSRDHADDHFPVRSPCPWRKLDEGHKALPLFYFCFNFWKLIFGRVACMSSCVCGYRSVWRLEIHVAVFLHPIPYSLRYRLSLNLKFTDLRRQADQWALGNYLPPLPQC